VAWIGEKSKVKGCGGERAGMRHFGRSKHRWKVNIKMDLKDIGWEVTGWIDLAQHRETRRALVNLVMSVILGFRHEADESCTLLRYYTVSCV